MVNYILVILVMALLVSLVMYGSGWFWAILALVVISAALLWRLRSFIGDPSVLIVPSTGTVFAEHAPVNDRGELLISYRIYAMLRRRALVAITVAVILIAAMAWIQKWVPLTTILVVPMVLTILVVVSYALISLLRFVPKGHRLVTLKKLIVADPRRAFARYSPKESSGVWKMGYVTYKKIFRVTVIALSILVLLIVGGLVREIYVARVSDIGELRQGN